MSTLDRIVAWTLALTIQPLSLVVMAAAMPLMHASQGSKRVWVRQQIQAFQGALEEYHREVAQYPPASLGLRALTECFGGPVPHGPYLLPYGPYLLPRRPYLLDAWFFDPWGGPYIYRLHGIEKPEIISLGADGVPGGVGANADVSTLGALEFPRQGPLPLQLLASLLFAAAAISFLGYPFLPKLLARFNSL